MLRPAHHDDAESPPVLRSNWLATATCSMAVVARVAPASASALAPTPTPAPTSSPSPSPSGALPASRREYRPRSRGARPRGSTSTLLLSLLSASSTAMAAACVSLQGSTTCSAFQSSSISTDSTLVGLYPFLGDVDDLDSFDSQLSAYVSTSYVQSKYETLLGCSGITLTNTSDLYARFTTTVICNAIIQNSISPCNLTNDQSRPVCAESCAQFAESEEYVVSDASLCQDPSGDAGKQIRADFTNCALPANSLSSGTCIPGITNEPDNCGYGNSTVGLCSYCGSGGINSTDTCCYNANAGTRCAGVVLPSVTQTISFTSATTTPTSSSSSAAAASHKLSGGAIAGIVVGSLVGLFLIAALALLCIRFKRQRRGSQQGSIFNQPSPARQGPAIPTQVAMSAAAPQGYEVLPGGRIARMSALEGHSGESPSHRERGLGAVSAMAAGGAAGYAAGGGSSSRRRDDHSSSDGFGSSPAGSEMGRSDMGVAGVLRPPPTSRRQGSLSSSSVLAGEEVRSPSSAGGMSSPHGVASQQSEQLPFFKDYYSQDDIHPGDRVAVLWAYQPRANDEFSLVRGDMLKVVGIWDDGWATGILLDENAEEWEARRQAQRDSGVSNTSGRAADGSPPVSGEIKAFPLVCVCLPEHWRKTIEGDSSTDTGSSAFHPGTTATGL